MITPRHARNALLSALTIATLAACSDGAESEPEEGADVSATTTVRTTVATAPATTSPTTVADPSTSAVTTTTDPTTTSTTSISTVSTVSTAPASTATSSTAPAEAGLRPIAAVVTVDDDGCVSATSLIMFDRADLVLPDGVDVAEDDLVVGTGDVVEASAAEGCEGTDGTVVFEQVERVVDIGIAGSVEPAPSRLRSVVFDRPSECGRGFMMTDADQEWAVVIEPVAGTATQAAGESITIPDERFGVVVTFGVDLMARNCEAGFEPFGRTPTFLAVWQVTEGSFVYPEAISCDGSSASTELVDAVVDTPDGPVELPPIEMVNTAFACGPGWDE